MHLSYVSYVDISGTSGENHFSRNLITSLARQPGVRLSVVTPVPEGPAPECLRREDVLVRYIPAKRSGSIRWSAGVQRTTYRALSGLAAQWGQQQGLVTTLRPAALAPAVYSMKRGVREILVVEGMEARNVRRRSVIPGAGLLMSAIGQLNTLRSTRVFVAYSEIQKWLGGMPLVDGEKIERFHHGIAPELYDDMTVAEARERVGWNLPDGALGAGFVGSFKWYHTVANLIQAVATDPEQEIHLLLVGEGPEFDSCRDLARELGLDEHVRFTGSVPPEQVPLHIAACDVLYGVIDPRHWGHPMKVYEYMAASRPFVYLPTEDLSFLDGLGAAIQVTDPDPGTITGALKWAGTLAEQERLAMGDRGRAFVLSNCTWDSLASRIVQALE